MNALSESTLSGLNWWLNWIAIIGAGFGLLSMIGILFIGRELASRERVRGTQRERKLASLEERQRDRELTPVQRAQMSRALGGVIHGKVWVTAPEGDQEAKRLAEQLDGVFKGAGLDSDWGGMLAVRFPKGITIFSSESSNDNAAEAIKRAFREALIDCSETETNVLKDHAFISVMVGSK